MENKHGMTDREFVELCGQGSPEAVRQTLCDGANPNAKEEKTGKYAATLALNNRLKMLMDLGAQLYDQDASFAETALMNARAH